MKTASPENTGGLFFGTKEERKQIALQLSQYFDRIFLLQYRLWRLSQQSFNILFSSKR